MNDDSKLPASLPPIAGRPSPGTLRPSRYSLQALGLPDQTRSLAVLPTYECECAGPSISEAVHVCICIYTPHRVTTDPAPTARTHIDLREASEAKRRALGHRANIRMHIGKRHLRKALHQRFCLKQSVASMAWSLRIMPRKALQKRIQVDRCLALQYLHQHRHVQLTDMREYRCRRCTRYVLTLATSRDACLDRQMNLHGEPRMMKPHTKTDLSACHEHIVMRTCLRKGRTWLCSSSSTQSNTSHLTTSCTACSSTAASSSSKSVCTEIDVTGQYP